MENKIFIWVPKTAGISISSVCKAKNLIELTNREDIEKYKRQNKGNLPSFVTFGHIDIKLAILEGLIDQEFYRNAWKFCVVRNPYSRSVSLYYFLQQQKLFSGSFDLFCDTLIQVQPKPGIFNVRGISQASRQTDWVPTDINKVYRLETINKDWKKLKTILGLTKDLPRKNKTVKRYPLSKLITKKNKQIIDEFYDVDFKRFNYDKNLPND